MEVQLARERLLDSTSSRLAQETATLNASIEQRLQGEEGVVQEALSRDEIDRLANEAGTDFNLYVGNQLQASSRPELYDAGVLDKRLSGLAFANTVLKGKRFYLQMKLLARTSMQSATDHLWAVPAGLPGLSLFQLSIGLKRLKKKCLGVTR